MPNLAWLLISSPLCFFCIELLITGFIFCHQNRMAFFVCPQSCMVQCWAMSYHKMIIHFFGNRSMNPQALPQITDCRLLSRHFYTPFESCLLNLGRNWLTERKLHQTGLAPWLWKRFLLTQREWSMRNLITCMHFRQPIRTSMVHSPAFSHIKERIYRATV